MTIVPQLLDILIVGKRMGDIERALDGAAIRIPPVTVGKLAASLVY